MATKRDELLYQEILSIRQALDHAISNGRKLRITHEEAEALAQRIKDADRVVLETEE